jgi:hypothetical protein
VKESAISYSQLRRKLDTSPWMKEVIIYSSTKYTIRWAMILLVPRFIKIKSGYHSGRKYNGKSCCYSNINDSLVDILPSGCSWNNLNPKCHSHCTKAMTQYNRRNVMPNYTSRQYSPLVYSEYMYWHVFFFVSVLLKMNVRFWKFNVYK